MHEAEARHCHKCGVELEEPYTEVGVKLPGIPFSGGAAVCTKHLGEWVHLQNRWLYSERKPLYLAEREAADVLALLSYKKPVISDLGRKALAEVYNELERVSGEQRGEYAKLKEAENA